MRSKLRKLGITLTAIGMSLLVALVVVSSYYEWPKTPHAAGNCLLVIMGVLVPGTLLVYYVDPGEPKGSPTRR